MAWTSPLVLSIAVAGASMPAAGDVQSRAERRTAELEARIAAEPDVFGHYLELAEHQANNRLFLDARATVVRAIDRLAALEATSPTGWRAPWLTGSEPAPMRVGGKVRPPKAIKEVKPVYPQDAQTDRVSGIVMLDVVVGTAGTVEEVQVRRADHPSFAAAAIAAVRQSQYEPATVDGAPVRVSMTVVNTFSIRSPKPPPDEPLVEAVRRRPDDLGARFKLARYYAARDRRADLMPALLGLRDALGRRTATEYELV